MKKFLTALLIASLFLAVPLLTAQAETFQEGPLTYRCLSDGTLEVIQCDSEAETVAIPGQVRGSIVTAIADTVYMSSAQTFSIPDSVTSVNETIFFYPEHLTEIQVDSGNPVYESKDGALFKKTEKKLICLPGGRGDTVYAIPNGTKVLGAYAFYNCKALQSVELPWSLTKMEGNPFFPCRSLRSIEPAYDHPVFSVKAGVLFNKADHIIVAIVRDQFTQTEYTLPDGIVEIGPYAFCAAKNLTKITFPSRLRVIGNDAFSMCFSLNEVVFTDPHLKSIGSYAFSGTRLVDFTVPEGVTYIGSGAFNFALDHVGVITLPDSLRELGGNPVYDVEAFDGYRLSANHPVFELIDGVLINKVTHTLVSAHVTGEYTVPDGIQIIGSTAFLGTDGVRSVTLPDTVTEIGDSAFANCYGLSSINIPSSVTTIGSGAFKYGPIFEEITIPASVTKIGENIFGSHPYCTVIVEPGSYAETYCQENDIPYAYAQHQKEADN